MSDFNGDFKNKYRKLMHIFSNITALIFVFSLSCYDENEINNDGKNIMKQQIEFFQEIINSKWLFKTDIVVLLNENDLFKYKIQNDEDDANFLSCFPEYEQGENKEEEEEKELTSAGYKQKIDHIEHIINRQNKNRGRRIHTQVVDEEKYGDLKCIISSPVRHIRISKSLDQSGLV